MPYHLDINENGAIEYLVEGDHFTAAATQVCGCVWQVLPRVTRNVKSMCVVAGRRTKVGEIRDWDSDTFNVTRVEYPAPEPVKDTMTQTQIQPDSIPPAQDVPEPDDQEKVLAVAMKNTLSGKLETLARLWGKNGEILPGSQVDVHIRNGQRGSEEKHLLRLLSRTTNPSSPGFFFQWVKNTYKGREITDTSSLHIGNIPVTDILLCVGRLPAMKNAIDAAKAARQNRLGLLEEGLTRLDDAIMAAKVEAQTQD